MTTLTYTGELSAETIGSPTELGQLREQLALCSSTLDCVAMLVGSALTAILTSDAQRLRAEQRRAAPPPEGE